MPKLKYTDKAHQPSKANGLKKDGTPDKRCQPTHGSWSRKSFPVDNIGSLPTYSDETCMEMIRLWSEDPNLKLYQLAQRPEFPSVSQLIRRCKQNEDLAAFRSAAEEARHQIKMEMWSEEGWETWQGVKHDPEAGWKDKANVFREVWQPDLKAGNQQARQHGGVQINGNVSLVSLVKQAAKDGDNAKVIEHDGE